MVLMTTQNLDFPTNRLKILQARYLAQAGANAALSRLKFDAGTSNQQPLQASMGEGSYSVTIAPAPAASVSGAAPGVLVVTSTGTVGSGAFDRTSAVLQVSAQVVCPFAQYLWGDFSAPTLNLNQTAGIGLSTSTSIGTATPFTLNGPLFSNGRVVLRGNPGPLTINGTVTAVDGVYALHDSLAHTDSYDMVNPSNPADTIFAYTSLTQSGQEPPGSGTFINGTINPSAAPQPAPPDVLATVRQTVQNNPSNPRYVAINVNDDTYVSLENGAAKVYVYDGSGHVPSGAPIKTVDLSGGPAVVYINDVRYGDEDSRFPQSSLAQADASSGMTGNEADQHGVIVSGSVAGNLTIATSGNVLVNAMEGGTKYVNSDASGKPVAGSRDLLTMVAGGAVNYWVPSPTATNATTPVAFTLAGVRVSKYRPRAPMRFYYSTGHEVGANSYLNNRDLTTRIDAPAGSSYVSDYDARLQPSSSNNVSPTGLQTVAQPVAWYWSQQQQGR